MCLDIGIVYVCIYIYLFTSYFKVDVSPNSPSWWFSVYPPGQSQGATTGSKAKAGPGDKEEIQRVIASTNHYGVLGGMQRTAVNTWQRKLAGGGERGGRCGEGGNWSAIVDGALYMFMCTIYYVMFDERPQ